MPLCVSTLAELFSLTPGSEGAAGPGAGGLCFITEPHPRPSRDLCTLPLVELYPVLTGGTSAACSLLFPVCASPVALRPRASARPRPRLNTHLGPAGGLNSPCSSAPLGLPWAGCHSRPPPCATGGRDFCG